MPLDLNYTVTVGSQISASDGQEEDRLLVSLTTQLGMDSGCGYCILDLADADYTPPAQGDEVTVELDSGEGSTRVFTGEVDTVETIAGAQRITAFDGISKLGRLELEASYEEVSIDDIVKDLMDQASVTPGKVDECPQVPSFVLFRGSGVLQHIMQLARFCGKDLYTDGQGQINFTGPLTTGTEHSFEYGLNILNLELRNEPAFRDSAEIWGEGAAGSQGADKYYWLSNDLAGLNGMAAIDNGQVVAGKINSSPLQEVMASLRSGEAVSEIAENRMQAVASKLNSGQITVYGSPNVMPGDTLLVTNLPENHSATDMFRDGGLRIRNVQHRLSLEAGFITRLEV